MSAWWERLGGAEPEPSGRSVYENREPNPDEPSSWVRVAEHGPLGGDLRWQPGWERRAQGWVPLAEMLRGAGK